MDMKKAFLIFLALILFWGNVLGEESGLVSGDFLYEIGDQGAVVTGWLGEEICLTVPEALGGYSVAVIGDYAFAYAGLEWVILPSTLKEIGVCAFNACYSLARVDFPEGLERIGADAFLCCESLQEAILPQSLKEIGEEAFWNCLSLERVELPADTWAGERAFANTPWGESVKGD